MEPHFEPRKNEEDNRAEDHPEQVVGLYSHDILDYSYVELIDQNDKDEYQRDEVGDSC